MDSRWLVMGILLIVGTVCLVTGFLGLIGRRRIDYLILHPWSAGINYATIPLGLWLVTFAVTTLAYDRIPPIINTRIFDISSIILIPLAFIFVFAKPSFIQPKWYRWLQKEHQDILHLLRYDARRNPETVKHRIQTQEGLEAWVAEVRQKKEYNDITDFTTH